MRFILHGIELGNSDYLLAARAAALINNDGRDVGTVEIIEFENGKAYTVRVNKSSVAVWPLAMTRERAA